MTALAFQNPELLRALADPTLTFEGPKALADHLGRDKSNTARTLKGLREDGVVRPGEFALTPLGRRIVDGLDVAEGRVNAAALAPRPSTLTPPTWPLDRIARNPANRAVDPDSIPAMADSLVAQGQLQPVTLTPVREDGTRMLLIGERRWLGARLARDQGRLTDSLADGLRFEEREATPAEALAITVVENVERQSIPPLELAMLLRDYADAAGEDGKPLDAKSVAERLGLGVRDVQDKIRIARTAAPEAIEAYREHGSWDQLRASVTEKKEIGELAPGPHFGDWALDKPWQASTELEWRQKNDHITLRQFVHSDGSWFISTSTQIGNHGTGSSYRVGPAQPAFPTRLDALKAARLRVLANDPDMPAAARNWLDQQLGPFYVNGLDLLNASNAGEARRALGWAPRQSNSGGGSLKAAIEDLAQAERATPRGDIAALTRDPDNTRARLALIEIAHKIGDQRRPLDPAHPADWTGDVDQDFLTHGCTCGAHWLDPHVQQLIQLQAARVVQIPGGHPPMLALTEAGLRYLLNYGCALPITAAELNKDQHIAVRKEGVPALAPGERYATACLATEAAPAAEPADADRAAEHAAGLVADQPDPWDRSEARIAADGLLLERARDWTARPDPLNDVASLLSDLAVHEARINAAGWVDLVGPDGKVVTEIVVDQYNALPDERVRALELLIAWAINTVSEGS